MNKLHKLEDVEMKECKEYPLSVEILKTQNAYLIEKGVIKISENYIKLGVESNGHLDIYFAPFLLNKFSFDAEIWFTCFTNNEEALQNYAGIYQQLAKEDCEYDDIDYEKWYHEQINKVIKGEFVVEDLVPVLNFTKFNSWV